MKERIVENADNKHLMPLGAGSWLIGGARL